LFWGFGGAQDPSSSLDLCTCVPVSVRGGVAGGRRREEARRVSTLSRVSFIFFFSEKEYPSNSADLACAPVRCLRSARRRREEGKSRGAA
jgi:hypothetical protein